MFVDKSQFTVIKVRMPRTCRVDGVGPDVGHCIPCVMRTPRPLCRYQTPPLTISARITMHCSFIATVFDWQTISVHEAVATRVHVWC